ncbi:DNA-binding response OmpR family regulator [Streptomyces umbrinus]|uniref:DNA-binding response OmpR family regulator n=1 Tax=Streptomyces umbrinus TaxID=67370 RepID=A0ABU0TEW1_9ACTN|nr:response regulator transcription factor [Streptomyces umbrinus]MDQ1033521.1 DNA-binding response OmpR family regulator [Streptomyces umbrinus]
MRARQAARGGGPCTVELAGRRCPRPAEHTLSVRGVLFRLCSACHLMTTQYLLDQHVPATEIGAVPSPAVSQTPRAQPAGPARPGVGPARPTQLLIVEDDEMVRVALQHTLTRFGYTVLAEGTGRAGLRSAYLQRPDLVLLDVMLPDTDGFEVLRRLRTVSDVPVIFLTARSDSVDAVVGLTSGADDYITKPCQPREIIARIERVLHRYRAAERRHDDIYDDGLLRLDSEQHQAWAAGSLLPLSTTEFRILDHLVRRAGTVQHFTTLLQAGWNTPAPSARDRVKFTISRLRSKLDATPAGGASIVSVRGIGYLYRSPTTPSPSPSPQYTPTPAGYSHTHTLHTP